MTNADRFERVGNNPSADFVNTLYSPENPEGSLRSAKDVIDFLAAAAGLAPHLASGIRRALAEPGDARRFFARALLLRSAVTAAFEAMENKRALPEDSLAVLNAILEADAGFDRLERGRGAHYEVAYQRLGTDPAGVLAPLARDTARLLAMPNAPVRKCAGDGCVRHFFDDSRTGRRRWCDMAICGNRAKAAAFAKRRRSPNDR